MKEGDIIRVLKRNTEDGWLYGCKIDNTNIKGLF